ncbi:MAG: hypothetical protein GY749_13305, partial [Desulfobacteraceae bacterium]|nr:hypothetical protein [Desulfobacteraceae bacterium]
KQTSALCLFYYPELTDDGVSRRKTVQDITHRYIDNLQILYRNIEFVGMSVYKPEATKGVQMEHIYIPVTVIPSIVDDEKDPNLTRTGLWLWLRIGLGLWIRIGISFGKLS